MEDKRGLIWIRKYDPHYDDAGIKKVISEATMSTVNSFYWHTIMSNDWIIHFIILCVGVVYVSFYSATFLACLMVIPVLILILVYVVIYLIHYIRMRSQLQTDLNEIEKNYVKCDDLASFWVAQIVRERLSTGRVCSGRHLAYAFIRDEDALRERGFRDVEDVKRNGLIIGTTALKCKPDMMTTLEDKNPNIDQDERETKTGLLKRVGVLRSHQRFGIATALFTAALDDVKRLHGPSSSFTHIEAFTTQCHESAKAMYASQTFELYERLEKSYCLGMFRWYLYRMRMKI